MGELVVKHKFRLSYREIDLFEAVLDKDDVVVPIDILAQELKTTQGNVKMIESRIKKKDRFLLGTELEGGVGVGIALKDLNGMSIDLGKRTFERTTIKNTSW